MISVRANNRTGSELLPGGYVTYSQAKEKNESVLFCNDGINVTMNKDQAQARADQIRAFQSELAVLQREGVVSLSDAAQDAVQQYHSGLLRGYAAEFDVDTSPDQKQLSWGMRLASLFGALALSAAVFFFFYRFWGGFGTPLQVGLLVAAPLLATLGVEFAARRERSLYFASLIALVAVACFVLNLSVLGQIFNITPSPNAFLAWAGFSLLLAYGYGLKLVLVAGLVSAALRLGLLRSLAWGTLRTFVQLGLIGYALAHIFAIVHPLLVAAVVALLVVGGFALWGVLAPPVPRVLLIDAPVGGVIAC